MSSYYGEMWRVYRNAITWDSFVKEISRGESKWIFLRTMEAGWRNRIRRDLLTRYGVPAEDGVPEEEVNLLLLRYENLVRAAPSTTSADELLAELHRVLFQIHTLKGYLRHSYYVQLDEPDDIVWTIDTVLSSLSIRTPTRNECSESYMLVTGKIVNSGAVVLSGDEASEVATYVAIQMEDMQKRLPYLPEEREAMVARMRRLDEVHSALTGKSLLGSEALTEKIPSAK